MNLVIVRYKIQNNILSWCVPNTLYILRLGKLRAEYTFSKLIYLSIKITFSLEFIIQTYFNNLYVNGYNFHIL